MGFDPASGPPRLDGVATIAISGTDSDVIDKQHHPYLALDIPATASFDGTALSFKGALDDGDTFKTIRDEAGVAVSITLNSSGEWHVLDDDVAELAPFRYIKLVSNATETAERSIPWIAFTP